MIDFEITDEFPTYIVSKNPLQFKDFIHELREHAHEWKEILLQKGALIFRGFPIHSADDFYQFIEALQLGSLVNYIFGDSPRNKVDNKIYTSTEMPAHFNLPLHQELSFVNQFPHHIYFYCQTPSERGGETTLGDARAIYQTLDPKVARRFQEKKLTYISHYYYNDKLLTLINRFVRSHKSWMEVFETNDKALVEKLCQSDDVEFEWLKSDWIKLKQHRPAVLTHPITQEKVWFNQAHLYDFNPKLLGLFHYLTTKLIYARPSTRLHEVTFSDGSSIERADLYHILDVLKEKTVKKTWQKGDVMVLDNILTMHGRAPFKGKRKILTALTKSSY